MKKILVTGGAGYIGSHAVKALLKADFGVVVVDNLSKGYREAVDARARFVELDLGDREALKKVFQENDFSAVMHFAGSIEVGLSMQDPAQFFQNNVVNGLNLLEAMHATGVKNIIFSSTAAVYGNPEKIPIKENAQLNPTNFYGQSKLMFEQLLQKYEQFYGFKYISLRYFNAAGADETATIGQDYDPPTHIVPRVLKAAFGQIDNFKVFGTDYSTKDGTCIRDYIHVSDLADAHILTLKHLLKKNRSNIFNLANGNGFSVLEVIKTAEKIIGNKIAYEIGPRREGDPSVLIADSTKASKILNWKPRFSSLEAIVASAWKWHLTHPFGYYVLDEKRLPRSIQESEKRQKMNKAESYKNIYD